MTAELQQASSRFIESGSNQDEAPGGKKSPGSKRSTSEVAKPKGLTAAQLRAQQAAALDERIRQVLEASADDDQFPLTGEVLSHQVGSDWSVVQKRLSSKSLKDVVVGVSLKDAQLPLALVTDAESFYSHSSTQALLADFVANKRKTAGKPIAAAVSKFFSDAGVPAKLKPMLAGVIERQLKANQLHERLLALIEVKQQRVKQPKVKLPKVKLPKVKLPKVKLPKEKPAKLTPAQHSAMLWDAFKSLNDSESLSVSESTWMQRAGLTLTVKELAEALKQPPLVNHVIPCKSSIDGKQLVYVPHAVVASADAKLLHQAFAMAIKLSQSGAKSKPSLGFPALKLAEALLKDQTHQQLFVDGLWSHLERGTLDPTYASLFFEGQRILFRRSDVVPQVLTNADSSVPVTAVHAAAAATTGMMASPSAATSPSAAGMFAKDFEEAFRIADAKNGGRNFVKVYELRQSLAQYSRAAFDAGLKQLRLANRYTMDSVFGASSSLTEAERAAGIQEGQSLMVYVSRK